MIVTCTHRSAEVQGIGVCYLTDWGKFGRVLQVATDVIIESQTSVIGKAGKSRVQKRQYFKSYHSARPAVDVEGGMFVK